MDEIELKGTKIVEVPYFASQLVELNKSVLIIGERHGGEGISETVKAIGFPDVTTTDIVDILRDSWYEKNRGGWKHIKGDFIQFDETNKYDYIISISVFEHFGFWFSGNRMATSLADKNDECLWNHDIRGINKACNLLKDSESKLIITLPAGPYMNYEDTGEPFLRYYDWKRQNIIKTEINSRGFYIYDEKYYHSTDYENWNETDFSINDPKNYNKYSTYSPNVIWAFTIKKK